MDLGDGDAKGLAVCGVQLELVHDVLHDLGGLKREAYELGSWVIVGKGAYSGDIVDVLHLVRRESVGTREVNLEEFLLDVFLCVMVDYTYQVEIVLNNVSFEGLERECSIAKGHDKGVVHKLSPYVTDVGALEEPFDKVAPIPKLARNFSRGGLYLTYGAKGSV